MVFLRLLIEVPGKFQSVCYCVKMNVGNGKKSIFRARLKSHMGLGLGL